MVKKTSYGVFLLLGAAFVVSLGINYFSPRGIALVGQWDKSKGTLTAKAKQDLVHEGIEINDPLVVKDMIQDGNIVLMDVRSKDIYDEGHIPGALCFPLADFDQVLPEILNLIKKDRTILVYCSGVECSDSHSFATQLMALKFTHVRVYAGGFSQWQEMGFRIEKNEV